MSGFAYLGPVFVQTIKSDIEKIKHAKTHTIKAIPKLSKRAAKGGIRARLAKLELHIVKLHLEAFNKMEIQLKQMLNYALQLDKMLEKYKRIIRELEQQKDKATPEQKKQIEQKIEEVKELYSKKSVQLVNKIFKMKKQIAKTDKVLKQRVDVYDTKLAKYKLGMTISAVTIAMLTGYTAGKLYKAYMRHKMLKSDDED